MKPIALASSSLQRLFLWKKFKSLRNLPAVVAVGLLAMLAAAQDPFDYRIGDMRILQSKKIQAAIGVSDAQRAQMNKFADANRARIEAYRQDLIKQGKKEFDPQRLQGFELNLKKSVFSVLKPDQLKRLREISLQHDGVAALGDDAVAAKVGLSPAQLKKVRNVVLSDRRQLEVMEQEAGKPIVDKYKNLKPKTDQEKKRLAQKFQAEMKAAGARYEPKVAAIVAADKKKIMDALTPAQRAKWDSLLGKPYSE